MRDVLLKFFVFSLGIVLAAVVAFRHQLSTAVYQTFLPSPEKELSLPEQIVSRFEAEAEDGVAEIARQKLEIPYAQQRRAMLSRDYSRERRAEILESAVEQGNLDSLQVIRSEYVSFLPEYRTEILPRLQRAALKELRIRFAEQDWLDWPSAAISNAGGPTQARIFVDNVGLVNDELGRFVETAAQLFHGMYLSILSGNSYSLKDDLFFVLQSAEKILGNRSFTAIPARLMLDPQILSKKPFAEEMERLRCDLTALHVSRYPRQLRTHLKLIEDLKVEHCPSTTLEAVTDVLQKITIESTQSYRAGIIPDVIDSQVLPKFAEASPKLKVNLAEFYVMSAVDALAEKSHDRAQGLLALSETIKTGLRSQSIVKSYLEKVKASGEESAKAGEEKEEAEKRELKTRFGESLKKASTQPTSSTFGSFIVYAVLLVALIAVVVIVVLWLLGRRAVQRGPKLSHDEEVATENAPVGAGDFDDEDFELHPFGDDEEILQSVARNS